MAAEGNNWCERCRVFALHSQLTPAIPTVQDMWEACTKDGIVGPSVGAPPEASLRLDAGTCQPCPDHYTSNRNGQCVFCPDIVIGNTCGRCEADVILDADAIRHDLDITADATVQNDFCPDVFWLRIDRPQQVYAHSANTFLASAEAPAVTEAGCNRDFTLFAGRSSDSTGHVELPTLVGTGLFVPMPLPHCVGFPLRDFATEAHSADTTALWVGTPKDTNTVVRLRFDMPDVPK